MDLHLQLQTIQKGNMSMDDYLQVKELSNHLSTIGELISHKDLILCIIRGLDSSYNSSISSLSIHDGTITFDDLYRYKRMLEHQANQVDFLTAD